MSYAKEWAIRCATRRELEKPKESVIEVPMTELNMEQPIGPLFMIFRRTVTGRSNTLYMGLTRAEAEEKYTSLNNKESVKREGTKPNPDEVIFFDIVEQGKIEQLSPYFNFRPTLIQCAQ